MINSGESHLVSDLSALLQDDWSKEVIEIQFIIEMVVK
jgi:hypothetical protein